MLKPRIGHGKSADNGGGQQPWRGLRHCPRATNRQSGANQKDGELQTVKEKGGGAAHQERLAGGSGRSMSRIAMLKA